MEVKNLLHLYDIFERQREGPISEEVLQHLQTWELIAKVGQYKCSNGHVLKLIQSTSCDGWSWRCYKQLSINRQKVKNCGTDISIRKGTFLEHSQLSIFQILSFSYLWLENTELNFIKKNIEISQGTATNFHKYCREICVFALQQNNISIEDEFYRNEFRRHPRRKFYRGAYEKLVFLIWCKLNKKNQLIEFMKFAGILHNPLQPSSYLDRLPILSSEEDDAASSVKEYESEVVEEDLVS